MPFVTCRSGRCIAFSLGLSRVCVSFHLKKLDGADIFIASVSEIGSWLREFFNFRIASFRKNRRRREAGTESN
jgi:hypothetical protein